MDDNRNYNTQGSEDEFEETLKREVDAEEKAFDIDQADDKEGSTEFNKFMERMRIKYGNIYTVTVDFETDEDTRTTLKYCFKKPNTSSYDRYVKTLSKSPTKGSRIFVLDNVIEEQKQQILSDLEKYPAIAIGVSDKLLGMLGLGEVSLKKL